MTSSSPDSFSDTRPPPTAAVINHVLNAAVTPIIIMNNPARQRTARSDNDGLEDLTVTESMWSYSTISVPGSTETYHQRTRQLAGTMYTAAHRLSRERSSAFAHQMEPRRFAPCQNDDGLDRDKGSTIPRACFGSLPHLRLAQGSLFRFRWPCQSQAIQRPQR